MENSNFKTITEKMGQDTSKSNYRPVSNLNFLSKLVEKCVFDQYTNHLDLNSLNSKHQSAYKAGHSCESALLKICNDIFWNMDKKDINLLIMLDLSTAFDTVSNKVLINLLEKQFGVSGTAVEWFQNYLHNRKSKSMLMDNTQCKNNKFLSASGKPSWHCTLQFKLFNPGGSDSNWYQYNCLCR